MRTEIKSKRFFCSFPNEQSDRLTEVGWHLPRSRRSVWVYVLFPYIHRTFAGSAYGESRSKPKSFKELGRAEYGRKKAEIESTGGCSSCPIKVDVTLFLPSNPYALISVFGAREC
jgi:hypothetical protein